MLGKWGYQLRKVDPASPGLQLDETDPAAVLYHTRIRPVLMTLPLGKARTEDLYPVAQHVFCVAALNANTAHGISRENMVKVLTRYRELSDYANGAERMGLTESEAPALAQCPGWFRLPPWDKLTVEQRLAQLERHVVAEGHRQGVRFASPDEAFLTSGGKEMIRVQANRLYDLARSIETNGYVRSNSANGDIKAQILRGRNGDWCWYIRQGNHRAAVACAHGVETLPVQVVGVVYRQDASSWPNVKSGVFTLNGALHVFDNLIEGRAPRASSNWLQAYGSALDQCRRAAAAG
jgi:hypothetical protein